MTKHAILERVWARPDPPWADDELLTLVEAAALIAVARRLFERSSVVGAEIAALLEDTCSKESPKPATPERGVVLRLVENPGSREGL